MYIRLLGTAAGGAFPQWNCNCSGCRTAREQPSKDISRSQAQAVVSSDGIHWFLLNASPDIRQQIASYAALQPPAHLRRGTPIEGVLLTGADLDQVLGLFLLREEPDLHLHCTSPVEKALRESLRLEDVLSSYGGVKWHEVPSALDPLLIRNGAKSGLLYEPILLPGKPPKYREGIAGAEIGDTIGYRIIDEKTGGRLLFLPTLSRINDALQEAMNECDLLILDGTFWEENEMNSHGVGTISASRMGHLPVGGEFGSLRHLQTVSKPRKIYFHINNTNPMLLENSPETLEVVNSGCEIAFDGMEIVL